MRTHEQVGMVLARWRTRGYVTMPSFLNVLLIECATYVYSIAWNSVARCPIVHSLRRGSPNRSACSHNTGRERVWNPCSNSGRKRISSRTCRLGSLHD